MSRPSLDWYVYADKDTEKRKQEICKKQYDSAKLEADRALRKRGRPRKITSGD